jgi:hypothetical protein
MTTESDFYRIRTMVHSYIARVKMTGIVRAYVTELPNDLTKIEVWYPHFSDPDSDVEPPHEYDWIAHYLSGFFSGDSPDKFTHISMGHEDNGHHVWYVVGPGTKKTESDELPASEFDLLF